MDPRLLFEIARVRGILWSDTAHVQFDDPVPNSEGGSRANWGNRTTDPIPCQVCADKRLPTEKDEAVSLQSITTGLIKFAYGTVVMVDDRIQIQSNGHYFQVVGVRDDRAEGVEVVAQVKKINDGQAT